MEQLKKRIFQTKELAEELHKRKVHLPIIDNIWGSDLGDMEFISKFNNGFKFLLCVIDIFDIMVR